MSMMSAAPESVRYVHNTHPVWLYSTTCTQLNSSIAACKHASYTEELTLVSYGCGRSISTSKAQEEMDATLESLTSMFAGFESNFDDLGNRAFANNIVSPPKLGCDVYVPGNHDDVTIRVMLDLCNFKHEGMKLASLSLLLRHMSQRVALMTALKDVQILVFPAAAKVYQETQFVIRRLGALYKHITADATESYSEAQMLLGRLIVYLTESMDNKKEIVVKNQKILLNLEIDKPVRNLLGLHLERDTSRRDRGELEADAATNVPRRELFQLCYTLLKLLARKSPKAQKKLFPFIKHFSEHVGIEKLNVADTIVEILRDNASLCVRINEDFLRTFMDAIKVWGRKARWLSFFDVFIVQRGNPMKRNQDLILRLLLEDKEALIDLTCDYTDSPYLSKSDERFGMSRLDLMVSNDHRRPVFSLLKYHTTALSLVAMCCSGKNTDNQVKVLHMISLETVMRGILDLDLKTDGQRYRPIDPDAIHFVQIGWLRVLTEVYLNSNDPTAIHDVHNEVRIAGRTSGSPSLIEVWASNMEIVCRRLQRLVGGKYGDNWELLKGVADEDGQDLGCHFECIEEIVRASHAYFSRWDVFIGTPSEGFRALAEGVRNSAVGLYSVASKLKYEKMGNKLVELITCMTARGIDGINLQLEIDEDNGPPPQAGPERCFQEGWTSFCTLLSHRLGVNPIEGRGMDEAIKDIALLFGSVKTHQNDRLQSLKQLLNVTHDPACDSAMKVLGLKVIRALMYMIPDRPHVSAAQHETEYQRLLKNLPPAELGTREFSVLQERVAKLGGVDVVTSCIESEDPETIMATLRLAVTMLDGGNRQVQNLFSATLQSASCEHVFHKLKLLFQQSVNAIKEQKRRLKQLAAQKAALQRAGVNSGPSASNDTVSLASSQAHMVEVMKMMRRMCMGQYGALQDALRHQPLSQASINLFDQAVQYIQALEPELKDCITDGDFDVVEGATRGFLMLADAMRGPNHDNQLNISQSGIFDLCDRLFARIRIDHVEKETKDKEWEQKKNVERSKLKCAITECLAAVLEGVTDDLIPQQMLMLLNWDGVVDQLKSMFMSYERGTDLPKELCLREVMQYYFLLKHVKNYDKLNDKIAPALADLPHKLLEFLEQRVGYIEIVRDGRLERCYFQLPEACVPGGELYRKSFDEMFDTEREEFDGKNRDYLENMVHIVDKVQFHDKIRQSPFAFTVKQWDLIRQINFMWTFLLHCLLVFGGYMPLDYKYHYQERVDLAYIAFADEELDEGRRKAKSKSGDDDDAKEFNLTRTDVYFFEEIEPVVEQIARYMNWINLITCGVRLFAFAWSEMPIVVRRALEDLDDGTEEEEDEPMFGDDDEEEPEEHDLGDVFIENRKISHEVYVPDDDDAEEHKKSNNPLSLWSNILLVCERMKNVVSVHAGAGVGCVSVFVAPYSAAPRSVV